MEIKLPEVAELARAVHTLTLEIQAMKKLLNRKDAYTPEEVSELTGLSYSTVLNYVADGTFEGKQVKKRGRITIPATSVEKYLQSSS